MRDIDRRTCDSGVLLTRPPWSRRPPTDRRQLPVTTTDMSASPTDSIGADSVGDGASSPRVTTPLPVPSPSSAESSPPATPATHGAAPHASTPAAAAAAAAPTPAASGKPKSLAQQQSHFEHLRALELAELREKGFEPVPVDALDTASVNIVDRACAESHLLKVVCVDQPKKKKFYDERESVWSLHSQTVRERFALFSCRCARIHYSPKEPVLNHVALKHASQSYSAQPPDDANAMMKKVPRKDASSVKEESFGSATRPKRSAAEEARERNKPASSAKRDKESRMRSESRSRSISPQRKTAKDTVPGSGSSTTRRDAKEKIKKEPADSDVDDSDARDDDDGGDYRGSRPRRSSVSARLELSRSSEFELRSRGYVNAPVCEDDISSLSGAAPFLPVLFEYLLKMEPGDAGPTYESHGCKLKLVASSPQYTCRCGKTGHTHVTNIVKHIISQHTQAPIRCLRDGCEFEAGSVAEFATHTTTSHELRHIPSTKGKPVAATVTTTPPVEATTVTAGVAVAAITNSSKRRDSRSSTVEGDVESSVLHLLNLAQAPNAKSSRANDADDHDSEMVSPPVRVHVPPRAVGGDRASATASPLTPLRSMLEASTMSSASPEPLSATSRLTDDQLPSERAVRERLSDLFEQERVARRRLNETTRELTAVQSDLNSARSELATAKRHMHEARKREAAASAAAAAASKSSFATASSSAPETPADAVRLLETWRRAFGFSLPQDAQRHMESEAQKQLSITRADERDKVIAELTKSLPAFLATMKSTNAATTPSFFTQPPPPPQPQLNQLANWSFPGFPSYTSMPSWIATTNLPGLSLNTAGLAVPPTMLPPAGGAAAAAATGNSNIIGGSASNGTTANTTTSSSLANPASSSVSAKHASRLSSKYAEKSKPHLEEEYKRSSHSSGGLASSRISSPSSSSVAGTKHKLSSSSGASSSSSGAPIAAAFNIAAAAPNSLVQLTTDAHVHNAAAAAAATAALTAAANNNNNNNAANANANTTNGETTPAAASSPNNSDSVASSVAPPAAAPVASVQPLAHIDAAIAHDAPSQSESEGPALKKQKV